MLQIFAMESISILHGNHCHDVEGLLLMSEAYRDVNIALRNRQVRFAHLEASTSTCPRRIMTLSCSPTHVSSRHYLFCRQIPGVMVRKHTIQKPAVYSWETEVLGCTPEDPPHPKRPLSVSALVYPPRKDIEVELPAIQWTASMRQRKVHSLGRACASATAL